MGSVAGSRASATFTVHTLRCRHLTWTVVEHESRTSHYPVNGQKAGSVTFRRRLRIATCSSLGDVPANATCPSGCREVSLYDGDGHDLGSLTD